MTPEQEELEQIIQEHKQRMREADDREQDSAWDRVKENPRHKIIPTNSIRWYLMQLKTKLRKILCQILYTSRR